MMLFMPIAAVLAATILVSCERTLSPESGLSPADSLAILRNAFQDPETCAECHPNHYQEWQGSMHAYAFSDPIFFRLNDIGQERSNQELGQFCIKCHSPLAEMFNEALPGFDRASVSEIAQKGIHCDVCHTIDTLERGQGITSFRVDRVKQGPIVAPWATSAHGSAFDRRYDKSGICAGCHDVTNPLDVQVEFTQSEWDNSPYAAMGLECQGCHMPVYTGPAATGGPERVVHRHTFIGADIPLIDFPGRDNTIALVAELLQNSVTMTVTAPQEVAADQPLQIEVEILNDKTGHNIPTGTTFERQMWLELVLKNASSGEVIYSSGLLDRNGDLRNHHSEEVASGTLPLDSDLALFHGVAKRDGQEVPFFWEADVVENNTIPAFAAETVRYTIPENLAQGIFELSVRLRFRSFPPYIFRAIGQEALLDELLIFDMETFSRQITVRN